MASKTRQEESETMEEVMNSMKHACELARNLESELPNMANQPHMLSLSIDEVLQAFNGAKERLLMMMMMLSQQDQTITASSFAPMLTHHDATQQAQMGATTAMQKLLIGSGSYTDQLFQMQQPNFDVRVLLENKMIGGVDLQQLRYNNRSTLQIGEMGGRDVEGSARSMGSEGDHVQKIEVSSSPRPRKSRKNDPERNTIMVPAPQVGNTEVPPEDGCTWRKYGQKEILGSKYPRGYFRCTHQKLYACPAKKQVQRLDHNPNMLEVTYRGEHTCHMSSTAPSASFHPPQLLVNAMTQSTISSQLSPSSTPVSGWLSSVNLSLCGGGGSMAPTGAAASSSAGPSTSRYGTDNYLVADMADVMFNSASSSGNDSMESLFPPTEDK